MIRTILVDDETLALDLMEKKLNKLAAIEVVGKYTNPKAFIDEMRELDFQVAFLDIEMTGISGLDLAEIIQDWNSHIQIVFVTAYRDYAIQAFEINSIDYLLKPVLEGRLQKTIDRLIDQIQVNQNSSSVQIELPSTLDIHCFNEFIVYYNNEPLKWKTAKVKELFAYFTSYLGTYVNRDTIIDQLWPDYDYKKAKINLHTCISHLRKMLDTLGYSNTLTYTNQSYSLSLDHFNCDSYELENHLQHPISINATNLQQYEKIMHSYTGEYMATNEYTWALTKAHALSQKFFELLDKLINYYHIKNMNAKKHECLQLLLKYNPYSENVLQQLLIHYNDTGNRGEAIKVYQQFESVLEEDLGIEPEPSTQKLYHSICNGTL